MKKSLFIAFSAFLLSQAGCTTKFQRVGSYTIASTHTLDLSKPGRFYADTSKNVRHERTCDILAKRDFESVLDEAIKSNPNCIGLVNAVFFKRMKEGIPIIAVEGNPLYSRDAE